MTAISERVEQLRREVAARVQAMKAKDPVAAMKKVHAAGGVRVTRTLAPGTLDKLLASDLRKAQ